MAKAPIKADIASVSPAELSKAIRKGAPDDSSKEIFAEELKYLIKWRTCSKRSTSDIGNNLTGLAISGGGIRSATFALGVVQALASRDKMKYFDYLSTVSGGGYLGSSLVWLTSQYGNKKFSMDQSNFPYGTASPAETDPAKRRGSVDQEQQLTYLRQHGKYLAPGEGIDLVSGVGVLLRGIALNALVWFPLAALLCWILMTVRSGPNWPSWMAEWLGWIPTLLSFMFPKGFRPNGYTAIASVGACAVLVFLIYALVYSFMTCVTGPNTKWRYKTRREFESVIRYPLWVFAACVPLALLPLIFEFFNQSTASGVISTFVGVLTAVWTHLTARNSRKTQGPLLGVVATIGAFLVLYGIALMSYAWATAVFLEHNACYVQNHVLVDPCSAYNNWSIALAVFVLISLISGYFVNINLISLHRFYRDRLMEAYMPDPLDAQSALRSGPALAADKARLSEFCMEANPAHCPYPLINANVILTGSPERTWRLRGGDSFLLSPRVCGSNATGWANTTSFLGNDMSLATAMAISGAAANPDAGGDLLRNRFVALLMALANVRLGYWVGNPRGTLRGSARQRNHFSVGWREISSHFKEDAKLVELSDGGHFDNLGLYELIRRRTRFIVLCDGTADPDFSFKDFISTLSRIKADFGASIDFGTDLEAGLATFIPRRASGYPQSALFAENGFAVGTIHYAKEPDQDPKEVEGQLIYVTSTLIEKVGLDVRGYKAAFSDFPDQTTIDQFFDEAQFEAYRTLGYAIAESMLSDERCGRLIEQALGPSGNESNPLAPRKNHENERPLVSRGEK
ncbi:Patatin-like phospholipase [Caballeronia hypogeia]|uniref:Patatin-like phospholipase n=1 Tax=Caballeronia hypogeia TaxID=1777140 RepID=A0A158CXK9_9BURK|nr:patatin-like phospholipase family protein [Caballeronia hypogeia]SAK87102.1 Patatin-like phospholipase [Caballeronia hypogeia]